MTFEWYHFLIIGSMTGWGLLIGFQIGQNFEKRYWIRLSDRMLNQLHAKDFEIREFAYRLDKTEEDFRHVEKVVKCLPGWHEKEHPTFRGM